MFQLQKYAELLFQVHWYFDESQLSDIENLLFVSFEKENDHYKLKKILYSYVDVLLGMEELNFKLIKNKDENKIIIE